MELSRNLLKDFANITTVKETTSKPNYIRGTVKTVGDDKFVQLDGSSGLTPLTEVVDVQDGDRVLVSIENHSATIVGNFSFPPSARKEQEALDTAKEAKTSSAVAQSSAIDALSKASDAGVKADEAKTIAGGVSVVASNAKVQAEEAINLATQSSNKSDNALRLSNEANVASGEARQKSVEAHNAVASAREDITKVTNEVSVVKKDVVHTLEELDTLALETTTVKETLQRDYSKKTDVTEVEASLKQEMTKSIGQLSTSIAQTYSAKSEVVKMTGDLRTQIEQNASGLSSTASKIETLESETTSAQLKVTDALTKAEAARTAATNAKSFAESAQSEATTASQKAKDAADKADAAKQTADVASDKANAADVRLNDAKKDLEEARQNLANVTNRVGFTESELTIAKNKVATAEVAITQALAEAAEAQTSATNAKKAASDAGIKAESASSEASKATVKADNAQLAANTAQAAANKAQEDVAALTRRVTKSETDIIQNAEHITLQATKTEEIGNSLKNNYYTKTQTDASLKVTSESIESNVSSKISGISIGSGNYFKNSNLAKTREMAPWNTSKHHSIYALDWDGYNAGITNPQTSFHAHIDTDTFGFNVIEFNESDGSRHWKGVTQEIQLTKIEDVYRISVDVYQTGEGCRLYGGLYYTKKGATVAYFHSGQFEINPTKVNKWERLSADVPLKDDIDLTKDHTFYIYGYDFKSNSIMYITNISLTNSTNTVDWHPSLSEMATFEQAQQAQNNANDAASTADSLTSRIENAETTIKQLTDAISMLVTDSNGTSLMTQTSSGWTFNMDSISKAIDEAKNELSSMSTDIDSTKDSVNKLDSLAKDLSNKTAYIVMTVDDNGKPCIELGKESDPFKVRVTNNSVDILDGTSNVTYVSDQSLFIEKAVIKSELQIGEGSGFVWKKRSNGNMGLRWTGG